MTAMPSTGTETSTPQGTNMVPVNNLVPVDTQLITPGLADALDLPFLPANVDFQNVSQPQAQAQQQTLLPQTQALKGPAEFTYQRNMYGGAQQPLLGNYYPQASGGVGPPGMFPIEPPEQGLYRQPPGSLPGPQGPQGFGAMTPQFNQWMDANVAGAFGAAQNPSKHPHDGNAGSDPDNDDYQARALKRPRLVWTLQLHQRFVEAVDQLGLKNAVPKTIMQLMNVDGLTRENVASHLQKYRLQLKKDGKEADPEKMLEEDGQKDTEPEKPRTVVSETHKPSDSPVVPQALGMSS